ncbi:MAG: ATP-binding protein, partial [Gammaproteobacteria bacterium]|nr:ATP-binding protein [Gammaproteobacteria bacterium]
EKYKTDIIFDLEEIETLTEEILEIERLNTNHTVLNKQNVSPDNLLKEVINAFYSEENIEINTETTNASLDPSRIKLLMKNLIGNAILHNENTITKTKSPLVELKKQNDTIIFSVQDFGKGISNEHIPHLTEPFYRVDPSRKRETGGYGLGLYLCRIIIEAHGGKLQIKSKINEGTEIKVTLPTNHI